MEAQPSGRGESIFNFGSYGNFGNRNLIGARRQGHFSGDESVQRFIEFELAQFAAQAKEIRAQVRAAQLWCIKVASEESQIGFHQMADGQHRYGTAQGPKVQIMQAWAIVGGVKLTDQQAHIYKVSLER